MKIAKRYPQTFCVDCPKCDAAITAPDGSGSLNWDCYATVPETVKCPECGEAFKIAKSYTASKFAN